MTASGVVRNGNPYKDPETSPLIHVERINRQRDEQYGKCFIADECQTEGMKIGHEELCWVSEKSFKHPKERRVLAELFGSPRQ